MGFWKLKKCCKKGKHGAEEPPAPIEPPAAENPEPEPEPKPEPEPEEHEEAPDDSPAPPPPEDALVSYNSPPQYGGPQYRGGARGGGEFGFGNPWQELSNISMPQRFPSGIRNFEVTYSKTFRWNFHGDNSNNYNCYQHYQQQLPPPPQRPAPASMPPPPPTPRGGRFLGPPPPPGPHGRQMLPPPPGPHYPYPYGGGPYERDFW